MDWNKRDLEILFQVKKIIKELYKIKKPVYVNMNKVGNRLDKKHLLEKYLYKLPLTRKYLADKLETREDYQLRRINWACSFLLKEGLDISRWRVKRIAGIKSGYDDYIDEIIGEMKNAENRIFPENFR